MGELNFFFGLQIKQQKDGIFINQAKYCKKLLKKFGMDNSKAIDTPMGTSCSLDKDEGGKSIEITKYRGTSQMGLWYPKAASYELIGYSDSDFAGCKLDRKSTSGTCHFLGCSLVSWHSKKQNSVALSTGEVEYVAAKNCCTQIIWMKQQLKDFGVELDHIPISIHVASAFSSLESGKPVYSVKFILVRSYTSTFE
ncbi:uncharacterized mitochondrial protein AtMg00810-like [Gastrolobium bilobum]|uniref:uncharacterized mitochondrial protein AtMg00810-like n=1 Tax=Gastrolobium bilobum TaxID=150636 RepID=UPI002AB0EEC2|nr:uncharacterized mitochondrial protein AtMg00810-like [Gastrolobium bilobum]